MRDTWLALSMELMGMSSTQVRSIPQGLTLVGPVDPASEQVLTPQALEFVVELMASHPYLLELLPLCTIYSKRKNQQTDITIKRGTVNFPSKAYNAG